MSPHASDGHESAAAEPADEDDEQEVDSHAAAGTSSRQQEHVGFPDLAEQLLVEVSSMRRRDSLTAGHQWLFDTCIPAGPSCRLHPYMRFSTLTGHLPSKGDLQAAELPCKAVRKILTDAGLPQLPTDPV